MRKYFLLSAVALMAATNVNAATDYAEVTAKATIEVASTFSCTEMDWGTIVVKQDNEAMKIGTSGTSDSKDFISSSKDYVSSECTYDGDLEFDSDPMANDGSVTVSDVKLTGTKGGTLTVTGIYITRTGSAVEIYGGLNIPANVVADDYTGAFTITKTY